MSGRRGVGSVRVSGCRGGRGGGVKTVAEARDDAQEVSWANDGRGGNARSRESKRRRRNGRSGGSGRAREGGGRTRRRVVTVVEARDNLRFVGVNAHAGGLSESVQEREGGDNVKNTGGGDSEVVGGSTDFEVGCIDEFGEQSVVAENEEEGGERAALFHTVLDVDGSAGGDARRDPDIGKQVLDCHNEPGGKALFGESGKDEVMPNGVEGFPVIGEKSKKLFPSTPLGVEFISKGEDMISEVTTWEKHLLMTADKVLSGINDAGNEGPGDDPVVSVVDADGASVLDQVGGFLWDEDQASAVKAGNPGLAGGEGAGNVEQERAREVGELLKGFEGDAVWAARGVGGRVNGVQDGGETQGLDKKRVDTAGVVGDIVINQRGVVVSDTIPDRGEVAFNEGPEDGGVLSGRGSGVGFEGNNRRARGGEDEFEFGEVVGAGFVGVGRGGEVVEGGFGGVGGAEGRGVDLAVGEEKEVDERAEIGEVPASCVTPGKFA